MQPDYLRLFDGVPGVLGQLLPLLIFVLVAATAFGLLERRLACYKPTLLQ